MKSPAAKLFFPLLLLGTLLKAEGAEYAAVLQGLRQYCLLAQTDPERKVFESKLAQLQAALSEARLHSPTPESFSALFRSWKSLSAERFLSYTDLENILTGHTGGIPAVSLQDYRTVPFSGSPLSLTADGMLPGIFPENRTSFPACGKADLCRTQNSPRAVTRPAYPF